MRQEGRSADVIAMDTSLYVLRNDATSTATRHANLDHALDAINTEIGVDDPWVIFELDRARVGARRRVAEGRGHINRPAASSAP
jgi:hypothetical protein